MLAARVVIDSSAEVALARRAEIYEQAASARRAAMLRKVIEARIKQQPQQPND